MSSVEMRGMACNGSSSMAQLKEAMLLLIASDGPLGPEWLDHPLRGDWVDHREYHIGGTFLLSYRVDIDLIWFVRAATHTDLSKA